MSHFLITFVFLFALVAGMPKASAWQTNSGASGDIKSCRLWQANKAGEGLIIEASHNFQGIRIVSKEASDVSLSKPSKYGFEIALWTDQNPIVNVVAWQDLYGIYVPFTVGRWINMWDFVLGTVVAYEGELRIGANRDEKAYPNNPDIRFDLTGIKEAVPAFNDCLKRELGFELEFLKRL